MGNVIKYTTMTDKVQTSLLGVMKEIKPKMANIKEMAQAYQPPQTKNISELDKFPIDAEVTEETGTRKEDGKEFKVNTIEVNGEKYRVPNSVLENIKALLTKIPNLKFVSVLKSGSGMNSRYQVLPMDHNDSVAEDVVVE